MRTHLLTWLLLAGLALPQALAMPAEDKATTDRATTSAAHQLLRQLKQERDPARAAALREKLQKAWIAAGPISAQVLLKQAESAQAAGLLGTAEELLRLAVRRWPDYAEARFRLAFFLWQTQRPQQALSMLDELLQRQPDHFPALLLRVRLLRALEDNEQALHACRTLLQRFPHWREMQQRCQRLQWRVEQSL